MIREAIHSYAHEALAIDPATLSEAEQGAYALMAANLRALAKLPPGKALSPSQKAAIASLESAAPAWSSGSVTCCPQAPVEAAAPAWSSGSVTCCPSAAIEATVRTASAAAPPVQQAGEEALARGLTRSGVWPGLPQTEALRRLLRFRQAALSRRILASPKARAAVDAAFRHYMAQPAQTAEDEALKRAIAVDRYHMGTAWRHLGSLEADLARLALEPMDKKDRLYALALFFDSAQRIPEGHPEYIALMSQPLPADKEAEYREAYRERDYAALTDRELASLSEAMRSLRTYFWVNRTVQRLDPKEWETVTSQMQQVEKEVASRLIPC